MYDKNTNLKHMKKFTFIFAMICAFTLSTTIAQDIKFGVKGGLLGGTSTTHEQEWQKFTPGYEIGIYGQYNIMDILGVSFEPSFARKGINDFDPSLVYFEGSPKLDFVYKDQKLNFSVVSFPVLAQLNLDMGMNVRIFGGPAFDYIAKASHYTLRDQQGIEEDFTFEMESKAEVTERFDYWNYTAVVGVGFDIEMDPVDLRIDVKYQHGFNNISVVENKPSLYTRYFGVTVGVGLDKLVF